MKKKIEFLQYKKRHMDNVVYLSLLFLNFNKMQIITDNTCIIYFTDKFNCYMIIFSQFMNI